MIQGCGSDVGKTLLVAGLCRLLTNQGLRVRPFKPQNMSNNAAVASDGGEVGRSTALQAFACRTPLTSHMNPVLLKPHANQRAQLIVRGQRVGEFAPRAHVDSKQWLLGLVVESFRNLEREADWIIVEGAGSPAETNLRTHDIANMGFAHAADVPVVLVGDIDRGHVIAALIGAHAVLHAADRERIVGFLINKFRGEVRLFEEGLATIVSHTKWRCLGVVPWLRDAARLPAEDSMSLEQPREGKVTDARRVRIGVVRLPHIANFDDFDPLQHEPSVDLTFVSPEDALPFAADLIILPGSKATCADLAVLRANGWEHDLHAYVRRGGRVLGICGGFQMLGHTVHDPLGIEGNRESIVGFELLNVATEMEERKVVREVRGIETTTGARVSGYEIHMGRSLGAGLARPMIRFDDGSSDGAVAHGGRVLGCHLHGLFDEPGFRAGLLGQLGAESDQLDARQRVDSALESIARSLEESLDISALMSLAR